MSCPHTDTGACAFCYAVLLDAVTGLRGLVRAVASETSIPMEEIEQSIDSVSGKQT